MEQFIGLFMAGNSPRAAAYAIGIVLVFGLLLGACSGDQRGNEKQEGGQPDVTDVSLLEEKQLAVPQENMQAGKVVYDQYCATCHQHKGEGVLNLNPPLSQTDYVTGDKERLIKIVLNGSNEGLEVNGMVYSNAMPANAFLSDQEIADVLSYIRNSFGNRADAIVIDEVSKVRASLE